MDLIKEETQSEQEFLANYDASQYDRPSVSVDILVFTLGKSKRSPVADTLQLLLIKRKNHPFKDHWALPGGFVEIDENLPEAACRELQEETSLQPRYFSQLHTYGNVGRDPRTRVISTAYLSVVSPNENSLQAGDDAQEAAWFDIDCHTEALNISQVADASTYQWSDYLTLTNENQQLSAQLNLQRKGSPIQQMIVANNGLAFDHAAIINHGLKSFRQKIKMTDWLFQLIDEQYFTLAQLQKVYEIVLGKTVTSADFWTDMADKILKTEKNLAQQPLYMRDPLWLAKAFSKGAIDLWN